VKIRGLLIILSGAGKITGRRGARQVFSFIQPSVRLSSQQAPPLSRENKLRPSESRNSMSWVPGRSAIFFGFLDPVGKAAIDINRSILMLSLTFTYPKFAVM